MMGRRLAHMEDKRTVFRVLVGKERDHYEDLDVDGRIILGWILEK
jgi:hypothetical protein